MKILVIYNYFYPAERAGGIVRSLSSMIRSFKDTYHFFVICGNHDLSEKTPLKDIKTEIWSEWEEIAKVMYLRPSLGKYNLIRNAMRELKPDVVYICGIYSLLFNLYPLYLRKRGFNVRLVLAPRGMLQKGALQVKPLKKKIYLILFKMLGMHQKLVWHATDAQEAEDIRKVMGYGADIVLAEVTPDLQQHTVVSIIKNINELKLVFISLITIKKNLKYLLECLQQCKNKVSLDIFGPVKDEIYWRECQTLIKQLPDHIAVRYQGYLHPDQVTATLQEYHFFVLPSLGENFGHAIYEALNAGRPVIISNRTPWKNLQKKRAGWDFSLDDSYALEGILREAAQMEQQAFDQLCKGAHKLAREYVEQTDFEAQYKRLFLSE